MDNNNDQPVVSTAADAPLKPRHSGWVSSGLFLAALAIVGLVVASELAYKRFAVVNQQLASQAETVNTKLSQDQAALAELQKSLDTVSQTVQSELATEQQAIGELRNAATGKKDSFNVSEADYLTNLANDNLQLGDNIPLVIRLLQTADQKLKEAGEANVLPIRKALAADIAALQSIPAMDVAGIFAELSALNGEVDKLPLPNHRPEAAVTTPATTDAGLSWWRRGWQQSLAALQKIVIVRYTQPGARPFIPPEQQDFLYQNLHANFAQAMTALVQRQPTIYRDSLQQATGWIQRYFLTDSPVTTAMMTALTRLQALNLRPTLPTLAASLQAFHDYYLPATPASPSATQS